MSNYTKEKKYLLEVKNLKKYFISSKGLMSKNRQVTKAVDGVSFFLKKGETLGIVGESGCGKSTTGNMIIRILDPTSGEIFFDGKNILKLNEREMGKIKKDIQMVFQDPFSSLNPRMRVFDIIAEPLRTHKIAKGKELRKEVLQLMETVGLDKSYSTRFPHEFSGGQRQRIGIARALALKPRLIICDEPVSALDVSIQAQILNLLIDLQRKFDLTFLFIAHGIPAVKYISDRIAVMYMGEIVEMAEKNELFKRTSHPYTTGLISSVPIPDPELRNCKEVMVMEDRVITNLEAQTGCKFYNRCPFGTEKCINEKPQLIELYSEHYVACHYPMSETTTT
ncbi:ABC transporter ATP-binding protein [Sporosarcina siberiensis]|uniref:ABC transporter ATP-binding protein n=1 Tax=Sporosarcina siberiensis TaxID=1365606 RepID=A0ABW4SJQ8_9BACL